MDDGERVDLVWEYGKRTVQRWRFMRPGQPHSLQHLAIGWWPDGRWWVRLTSTRLGWVFPTETPAWDLAERIRSTEPDLWSDAPAEYVPGTTTPTAAPRYPNPSPHPDADPAATTGPSPTIDRGPTLGM